MNSLEESGKTVEEATAKALRRLGRDRSQVDVEIVSQGRPGILGFGGEPARVIVRPHGVAAVSTTRPAAPAQDEEEEEEEREDEETEDEESEEVAEDPVDVALEIIEDLLDLLGIDADIVARDPVTPGDGAGMVKAVLDVEGDDLGMLIGRRGETLVSLQYLLNLMIARRTHTRAMVGIDIGGYKRRREDSLRNLANRMADRVRITGQSVTLEPMPPSERRIIHIALSDHPDVLTVSIGEGEARKVAITPRR